MNLILQLKEEHVQIVRLFEEVKSGISDADTDVQTLVENLRNLKESLAAHLDLEDKLLYPKLASSDNEEAQGLGKKFSGQMLAISNTALVFFRKYILTDVQTLKNNKEFEEEISGIIEVVLKRVELEENTLFPAFEKYCEGKGVK